MCRVHGVTAHPNHLRESERWPSSHPHCSTLRPGRMSQLQTVFSFPAPNRLSAHILQMVKAKPTLVSWLLLNLLAIGIHPDLHAVNLHLQPQNRKAAMLNQVFMRLMRMCLRVSRSLITRLHPSTNLWTWLSDPTEACSLATQMRLAIRMIPSVVQGNRVVVQTIHIVERFTDKWTYRGGIDLKRLSRSFLDTTLLLPRVPSLLLLRRLLPSLPCQRRNLQVPIIENTHGLPNPASSPMEPHGPGHRTLRSVFLKLHRQSRRCIVYPATSPCSPKLCSQPPSKPNYSTVSTTYAM